MFLFEKKQPRQRQLVNASGRIVGTARLIAFREPRERYQEGDAKVIAVGFIFALETLGLSSSGKRLAEVRVQFLFADHTLDTDTRELCRRGTPIAIKPQASDLLTYLVQTRDRVVSKDDLLTALWGGRIVADSTLATHIKTVRGAIGDRGEEQALIRTFARKGVRFVGKVQSRPAGDQPAPSTVATNSPLPAAPRSDRPVIAVLPFVNMSGDAEQEYFSDGLSEDLIAALSKLRWFFVIARNSSFSYKGRSVHLKQIGEELGVGYVVEGSVRKAGERVRITVQLNDVTTGSHLWAERAASAAVRADGEDPWAHFALAMVYSHTGSIEDSLAEYETALRLNPNFSLAQAGYALVLSWGGRGRESAAAADRAIRLSPRDSFSAIYYAVAGYAAFVQRDYGEAIRLCREGIRQRNDFVPGYRWITAAAGMAGDTELANSMLKEFRRVHPNVSLALVRSWLPVPDPGEREHFLEGLRRAGLD